MWKDPPSDITVSSSSSSPLSQAQRDLLEDIRKVYRKYRRVTSLRVYYLGYEEPSNLPWRKNTPGGKKRKRRRGRSEE